MNVYITVAVFLLGVTCGAVTIEYKTQHQLENIAYSVGTYVHQQQQITNALEITQPAMTAIVAQKAKLIKE